jgi:hypothetical protein
MRLLVSVLALALLLCNASFGKTSSHSKSGSHHTSQASKTATNKTVHVSGYTRYRHNYAAEGVTLDSSVQRDKHGKIKRSEAAKDAFKREQPCPATGKSSGKCPGYVIDHVNPLECGGADAATNMQWQTVADGKAKDKTERYCR